MRQARNVVTILVGIAAALWIASGVFEVLAIMADILALFGFAWLLNLLIEPFVDVLNRRLPRPWAWALGYLSVLLVLAAFTAPLAAQATTLPDTLPRAIQRATQQADDFLAWLRGRHIPVPFSVSHALESGVITEEVGPSLLSWSLALLNTGGQFLLVICIAAAMAAGDNTLRSLILAAMPTPWLKSASLIYDDVRRTYSAAIRGQLAVWSIGMALSLGTMAAFGTPGLLLWIGPIALVRLLPYLGGALGGTLTIAIILLTMPWPYALVPAFFVFVLQNIFGYIIEPRILGRALQLSPVLVLFAVLVGWKIGGITGIVFGVPAIAFVQTLAEHRLRTHTPRQDIVQVQPARATGYTQVDRDVAVGSSATPPSTPLR